MHIKRCETLAPVPSQLGGQLWRGTQHERERKLLRKRRDGKKVMEARREEIFRIPGGNIHPGQIGKTDERVR